MCVIRMAAVGILVVVFFAPAGVRAQQNLQDLLAEGIQADSLDNPVLAREKYQKVLDIDPNNYHALVRMAQIEMKQLGGPKRGDKSLLAQEYLLRASLSQPDRPEAYLALAQLHYTMGYIEEGDSYARMAKNVNPESYEAFCLMGQRYEDSGNLFGALRQYSAGLAYYPYDAYLSERRFLSAKNGGLQPYDIYSVDLNVDTGGGGGEGAATNIPIKFQLIYEKYPDFYQLSKYEEDAGVSSKARGRYFLPDFAFKYCRKEDKPTQPYDEQQLYDAFIKSSTSDPAEYSVLRAELDKIRAEARQVVAAAKPDGGNSSQFESVVKAKALYTFLKAKILKDYDIRKGVSAKALLDQKRYLCLNASILFVLIGREVGLPVDGFIRPGHAFAVLHEKPRDLTVDLIPMTVPGASGDKGFGINWKDQFVALNEPNSYGGLYAGASDRNEGEVSPAELTAYQFVNMLFAGLEDISDKHRDEELLIRNLMAELIQTNRDTQSQIMELKNKFQQEPDKLAQLINKLRADHMDRKRATLKDVDDIRYKIDQEKSAYLMETGLKLMESARAIAPDVEEFVAIQEMIYALKADTDTREAQYLARDREHQREELLTEQSQKQLAREFELHLPVGSQSQHLRSLDEDIAMLQTRIEDLDRAEKETWPSEKGQWMEAINDLSTAHKQLPCSNKIQKRLEAYLWSAAKGAKKNDDNETLQEVVSIGLRRLPDSEFSKHFRADQL